MKVSINVLSYSLAFLLFSLGYSPILQAKKRCKPFLEKLHKIQAMQRHSYSLKRGQSLRAREDKARDKWWQCEHMSLAKFNAKNGSKKKKSKKKKSSKYARKNNRKKKSISYNGESIAPFNQSSAIVIKAKYQGSMKQAWLQFYQQPIKCQRPKNLNVFAYCSEDKLQQQNKFEQSYTQ